MVIRLKETEPCKKRQTELSVEDGCILLKSRVVLPPKARDKMVSKLHSGQDEKLGKTIIMCGGQKWIWF